MARVPVPTMTAYSETSADMLEIGFAARIVVVSGTTIYTAFAQAGSKHTDPVWACCRMTEPVANTYVYEWADGNLSFDNIPGANGAGLLGLSYS